MGETRRRISTTLLVVGIVAATVVILVVDRRASEDGGRDLPAWVGALMDVAAPVQRMARAPIEALRGTFSRYVALVDTQAENERLWQRIYELEEESLQLREALVASGRLQRIAEMRERYEIPMLPAELVGADGSPWFRSVLVDRGRAHGIRSGMPVLSEQGLVGLVTATSSRSAKATLVLDRQTAIDGVVQRSRARGIVRGKGANELVFEFVARGSDVQAGDEVLTSGLDGVYPKGLRIGTVREVAEPGSQLLQQASVQPSVDFGRLEQVFIMLRRSPTMDLLYSTRGGDEEPDAAAGEPAS